MKRVLITALSTLLFVGILAAPASAGQAIDSFDVTTTTTQAGGHPDLGMSFELDAPGQPEAAKDIVVNTPGGVFGNPNAILQCTSVQFSLDGCPPGSQAGLITVRANYVGDPNRLLGTAPIYNRETVGSETALFSFVVPTLQIPVSIPVAVRTAGDYGLRLSVSGLTQLAPLAGAELTLWGFPADSSNDGDRFRQGVPGEPSLCPGLADTSCSGAPVPAGLAVRPMINNPSVCGQPLGASLDVSTYQDPNNPTRSETAYPATTGCHLMTFDPVLQATPTTREADSPSGLDLTMNAPQPLGQANTPSSIKRAVLTLPDGLNINPDAADGQSACEDEDANFGTEGPHNCPDNAKIGTFDIGSPALDGDLGGSIYFGEPKPGDQYRLFFMASGFGINAKFVGSFKPDEDTGQVTAFIGGDGSAESTPLPQVPFDRFELHLFASDRGLMATPTRCAIHIVEARFFPWNDALPDQTSRQVFSIDSGPNGNPCPGLVRPFEPRLIAGTTNPLAGGFSDFALQLDRDDGDQYLGDLGFTMPPGFTGSLVGIDYCPESDISQAANNPGRTEQSNPSCPSSSQIGTTNVSAGPGDYPFNVEGKIYLSGPFKGAPLSLAAVTPALAGPYDYGTQVVRVAVNVDPLTARVRAISDTVPQIIGGVPLRMRRIRVSLNRDEFLINPTNCSNFEIQTEGIGDQGTRAEFASPFHAVNCFKLPFKPRMRVRQLGGRKATRRSVNPSLLFDLWTGTGHANLRRAVVILSNAFQIDQANLFNICSEAELAANDCEGRQPIGRAWTKTPLLDRPIAGNVYAVSGSGGLPRLAFVLEGQVRIVPRADTSTAKGGRLKTVVPVIPDAPVGHFRFRLFGGKNGYLINNRSLCAGKRPPITLRYLGHNGKRHSQVARLQARCGKGRRGARRASIARAAAVG